MNSNLQTMDHRWGVRIRLDAPGQIRTANGTTQDMVVANISLSGAFVLAYTRLAPLSPVWVRVGAGADNWLQACVVRRDQLGMGLEWREPGAPAIWDLLASRDHPETAEMDQAVQ